MLNEYTNKPKLTEADWLIMLLCHADVFRLVVSGNTCMWEWGLRENAFIAKKKMGVRIGSCENALLLQKDLNEPI